ncbi:hypothetical protein AB0J20_14540 [Micromonospora costi]|uniref:hypothetical protein n=1 Tax=Micromonospora costi TaxID=1530042 RepID=UPI0033E0AE0C
MPENYTDPSGNTEAFRAFAASPEPQVAAVTGNRLPMIVGAAVVAAVLLTLAVWLAVG